MSSPPTPPPPPPPQPAPDTAFLRRYAGRFLVFEGPDGSGKSTQFRRLSELGQRMGIPLCEVREPGGTPVGERIRRHIVLARAEEGLEMSARCEMLLYMASRAELVEKRIIPALSRGELVLADRYVASTLAYQGAAGGVPTADIAAVARAATRNLQPDLVLLFDIDEISAARRLSPLMDRMEAKGAAFHRMVRRGYLDQARADPGRYAVLDASRSPDEIWSQLLATLKERSNQLGPPRKTGG